MNKQDQEIARADQKALEQLVADIIKNKRLSWMIVDQWLAIHNKVLQDADQAGREFKVLINQMDKKHRPELYKIMSKKQSA